MAILALTILVQFTDLSTAPSFIVRAAQAHVVALFREVGVRIEWAPQDQPQARDGRWVRLSIVPAETGRLRNEPRTVLGAATRTPHGRPAAWVFYRRVASEAERRHVPIDRLLACAMAHELGHLLQRGPTHAADGLMAPNWKRSHYWLAARGRLRFTLADAEQFHSAEQTTP